MPKYVARCSARVSFEITIDLETAAKARSYVFKASTIRHHKKCGSYKLFPVRIAFEFFSVN